MNNAACLENYNKNGFIKFENVLDKASLVMIRSKIDSVFDDPQRFPSILYKNLSMDELNRNSVKEINYFYSAFSQVKVSTVFLDCQKLAAILLGQRVFYAFDHAIYKSPGGEGVSWHQDDAYKSSVKEMKSVAAWIPLQDVDDDMGCMTYVSGSNLGEKINHLHCSNGNRFITLSSQQQRKKTTMKGNFGDVIFHSPRTIHGSLPNTSNKTRKAWIIHFSPYGKYEPILPSNIGFNIKRSFCSVIKRALMI